MDALRLRYAIPLTLAVICLWILWSERFRSEKLERSKEAMPIAAPLSEFVSMDAAAKQAHEEARRVKSYWAQPAEVAAKNYSGRHDQT